MIVEVDYAFNEFDDVQLLWAHLAISALQAGYVPIEVIIGYS